MLNTLRDLATLRVVRQRFRETKRRWRADSRQRQLDHLRRQIHQMAAERFVELEEFVGELTDAPNGYIQYKDLFFEQIYRFNASTHRPLIIDSGSNIGMSIVYFKRQYPEAKVIGFEPDPQIFQVLQKNVQANHLENVQLVQAALGAQRGTACFTPDGEAGGKLADGGGMQVKVERLSDYVDQPVDFLKLNIEGAEWDVLDDLAQSGRLQNVREMVIEYHGWPDGEQRLGKILNLLDEQGFRFLIHDFDHETCGASKPPFRWTPKTTWFCLVYAIQHSAALRVAA